MQQIVRTLATDYQSLLGRLESLTQQVLEFRRRTFGVSSEHLSGQGELFIEAVTLPVPPTCTERITYERQARGRPGSQRVFPASASNTHSRQPNASVASAVNR